MQLVLRAAALGLMVAMAAACGTGGDTNANQPNTSSRKPAEKSADKPAKPVEKPAQPADSKGGDGSAYCDKVHELGDSYDPLSTLANAQSDPDGVEALKQLANIYVELAKVAPGEIKAELEGSRDLFEKVVQATESGKTSDPELEAQAPKVAEWGVKIQEYTVKHCA